jgi:hypothetical protein
MAKPDKKRKACRSNVELSNKPMNLLKRVRQPRSKKKYSKGEHETETMYNNDWIH